MKRTTMRIGVTAYPLAQGQDIDAVTRAVTQGVRDGGDFVTVTVVGNRSLDILVTTGVPVTFESEDVTEDAHDNGDLTAPFDVPAYPEYDF